MSTGRAQKGGSYYPAGSLASEATDFIIKIIILTVKTLITFEQNQKAEADRFVMSSE